MDPQDARNITESDMECMLLDEAVEPRALPFSLLEKITDGFSYKGEIGRGGFAVVYLGTLENGFVAIKKLYKTHIFENQFIREVECLMKVKHKNVVRFLGYCSDTQGYMERYNGKLVMAERQERLLCFEYVPNGSLDGYIKGASGGLEWRMRYPIIKGICEGLHYLHLLNIMNLDLKPSNILMDDKLIPKITDFGLSRSFEELQTRVVATKMCGTLGYLAPEFTANVITHKFDLYSLGVIILEMLSGEKECHSIENILESWGKRLNLSQGHPEWEQIKVCAEIGIKCTNIDPEHRPASMKSIMDRLAEMESVEYGNELHPLKHCFYIDHSDSIPCWLHLTNKTDEDVAFRLMERTCDSLRFQYSRNPLYGGMPPGSSCTLIMTSKEKELAEKTGIDLVLQSTISRDRNIKVLKNEFECNKFFEEGKELGHAVYEVALKAWQPGESTSEAAVRPSIVIEPVDGSTYSMDAHPTEPWIVMGHYDGSFNVWNYESKTRMDSFKISEEEAVTHIKFHATKKWIMALTRDGFLHVYDCACLTQIQKITSFKIGSSHGFAIHPTKSYVLSSELALWDWDKGWQCTRKVANNGLYDGFAFNPEDPNILARMQCTEHYVKVSSLDPPTAYYTLRGHSDEVYCLAFFKHGHRQCLITGSKDCTAKIWDLQTKACIHTIEGLMRPVRHVISLPGRPYRPLFATFRVHKECNYSCVEFHRFQSQDHCQLHRWWMGYRSRVFDGFKKNSGWAI